MAQQRKLIETYSSLLSLRRGSSLWFIKSIHSNKTREKITKNTFFSIAIRRDPAVRFCLSSLVRLDGSRPATRITIFQWATLEFYEIIASRHLPARSVTSRKIGGIKKLGRAKMFDFRRITLLFRIPLSQSTKWLYVLKVWVGAWPPKPPLATRTCQHASKILIDRNSYHDSKTSVLAK